MFNIRTRILVVDDFKSMREMMIDALKMLGYTQILQAEDGDVAWRALSNIKPPVDLVIADWNMPKSTGYELLQKIRSDPRFKDLPFIMSTTENEKDKVLDAIKAGVTNYIVKPFTAETIRVKLEATAKKLAKGPAL